MDGLMYVNLKPLSLVGGYFSSTAPTGFTGNMSATILKKSSVVL